MKETLDEKYPRTGDQRRESTDRWSPRMGVEQNGKTLLSEQEVLFGVMEILWT